MKQFVALQWYYNEREEKCIIPELSAVFGPFPDRALADQWVSTASTWGGWGKYEYQVEEMYTPTENVSEE